MADHSLDLSDPSIREMARFNHTPEELWTVGGELLSVYCSTCNQSWPCGTIIDLRATPRADTKLPIGRTQEW